MKKQMEILKCRETLYESPSMWRDYYNEDSNVFTWKHGVALVKSLNNEVCYQNKNTYIYFY